jgi:hypothetical protein
VNLAFLNVKLSKLLYGTLPNNKEKCLTPTRKLITGRTAKKKRNKNKKTYRLIKGMQNSTNSKQPTTKGDKTMH